MLSVLMLSVLMLSVLMLNVVMLSVTTPLFSMSSRYASIMFMKLRPDGLNVVRVSGHRNDFGSIIHHCVDASELKRNFKVSVCPDWPQFCNLGYFLKAQGPYIQRFIFFVSYEWAK